jgi:hypothetical protein
MIILLMRDTHWSRKLASWKRRWLGELPPYTVKNKHGKIRAGVGMH